MAPSTGRLIAGSSQMQIIRPATPDPDQMTPRVSEIVPSTRPPASRFADLPPWLRAIADLFLSRRFATFIVFGGLAAIVNLVVGSAFYTSPQIAQLLPYWLAVAIGAASGLLVNFGLNYAFNFRYGGRSAGAQLRTFIVVALVGVALSAIFAQTLMWLVTILALPERFFVGSHAIEAEFVAHVIATGMVMFYSFAAHSAFSFNVGLRRRLARLLGREPGSELP